MGLLNMARAGSLLGMPIPDDGGDVFREVSHHQRGWLQVGASSTILDSAGLIEGPSFFDATSARVQDTADSGLFTLRQDSDAVGGVNSIAAFLGPPWVPLNTSSDLYLGFSVSSTADIRLFCGWQASASLGTIVQADAPLVDYIGLQFSKPRGDTTLQLIHSGNNGVTQTIVDTGIGLTAFGGGDAMRRMRIAPNVAGSQIVIEIEDSAGNSLFSTTATSNLPVAVMRLYAGLQAQIAAVKSIHQYGADLWAEGAFIG